MRPYLVSTLLALSIVAVPTSSSAASGSGVATPNAADFFRPTSGFAAIGVCTFDGVVLTGEAQSFTMPPGFERDISLTCDIRDRFGRVLAQTIGGSAGPPVVAPPATYFGANPAYEVCGLVRAFATTHPAGIEGFACGRVMGST